MTPARTQGQPPLCRRPAFTQNAPNPTLAAETRLSPFGSTLRAPPLLRRAFLASWLAAATCAQAQYSRLADEVEWKRLDLHPKPVLLGQAVVHGRLDLGLRRTEGAPPGLPGCEAGVAPTQWNVGGAARSHLGWRDDRPLGGGYAVHLRLEHSFDPSSGTLLNDCGVFFDAASTLGLSHQDWGLAELGRRDQPAWLVALLADPWDGHSVAAAGIDHYGPPPGFGGRYRTRAEHAITLSSRSFDGLSAQWQRTLPDGGAAAEQGAAVHLATGSWRVAAGWQRWDADNRAVPLAAQVQLGFARLHVGHTAGHQGGHGYRHAMVGAAIEERGGARRGIWRVGASHLQPDAGHTATRLSVGYELPLSRRVLVYANATQRHQGGEAFRGVDVGIRQSFSVAPWPTSRPPDHPPLK
jgi:hypothetical protein